MKLENLLELIDENKRIMIFVNGKVVGTFTKENLEKKLELKRKVVAEFKLYSDNTIKIYLEKEEIDESELKELTDKVFEWAERNNVEYVSMHIRRTKEMQASNATYVVVDGSNEYQSVYGKYDK